MMVWWHLKAREKLRKGRYGASESSCTTGGQTSTWVTVTTTLAKAELSAKAD